MSGRSVAKVVLLHLAASEIVLIPATIVIVGSLYSLGLPGFQILFWTAFGLVLYGFFRAAVGLVGRFRSSTNSALLKENDR